MFCLLGRDGTKIVNAKTKTVEYCLEVRQWVILLFGLAFHRDQNYVYSQASRSKLLWVSICPHSSIFIIIILKEKGVML